MTSETVPSSGTSVTIPTHQTSTGSRWIVEWSLITVAVLFFCSSILDLGKPTRLPGNETEVFQTLDWNLVHGLREHKSFPLWNPYLSTGLPYIADPMLHIFNPVSTLPVLILGARDGFKVAVALSFLLAALGMWWLGMKLGLSPLTRLWVALMYAFAGQPVARFFQGQYLFILGFAWIPWAAGSLLGLIRSRRRVYWAGLALSLAMLFFSGNVYYAFYMLVLSGLFALVYVVGFRRDKPYISIDRKLLITLLGAGALTLGVMAVQLLPLAEFWPRLSKSMEVVGAHSLQQITLDFTSKDTFRPDAYQILPAREEYYAYIGKIPLLALLLLPLALWKRERRPILVLGLLLLFAILWINIESTPFYAAFLSNRLFFQFRHLLRILIFASFAILLMAALGLDTLWRMLDIQMLSDLSRQWGKARAAAANLGLALLGALMLVSVGDVYQTNRKYAQTQPVDQRAYQAAAWLRKYDGSDYYVRFNPNNLNHDAVISTGLRFIEAWYHFSNIGELEGSLTVRPLQARPNYIVQPEDDPPPESPGATVIQQVSGYSIFHLPASLPYAFSVKNGTLFDAANHLPLQNGEVIPQTTFSPGPNKVEVIANAQEDETLVVLTTHYPDWTVRMDGRKAELLNVGGYLGAKLLPGVHKYTFAFQPRLFYIGLVLSLLCTGAALFMLISGTRPVWQNGLARLRAAPRWATNLSQKARLRISTGRQMAQAVYSGGSLHPDQPLALGEDTSVRLVLEPTEVALTPAQSAWRWWLWATSQLAGALWKAIPFSGVLFVGSLIIYAITRLYALERFPIYFFGDEAVQVLFAQDLIARRFHAADGTLFPIYVEAAGNRWTPLISMYFHALTLTLFGKSIVVARATSVVVSLLGVGAVGIILHRIFKARYAWAGILLVAVTPAWFLHSRTAFETVMTTSFYACFLLCYLLYRTESPRYLYAAVAFGAATFYSYSNAQAIILAAAALLFISDWRYHLQNRETLLRGLLLAVVLAIPFIEFRLSRPQAISEHLRIVGSYWYQAIPLQDKFALFAQKYLYALSPQYWFLPNATDLPRHRMAGFGQMQTAVLPFVLLGLALSLARWRSPQYRAIILAGLAVPTGAALVDVGIARVLAFVIPANLLATIGLEWLLERWKAHLPYNLVALALFVGLTWANFALLRTALLNGPLWFRDYGLYGMQYGARQLFEEAIPEYLARESDTSILVSSTWANGADNFLRFFFTPQEQQRVRMDGVETYLFKILPLDDRMVFVMIAAEYQQAKASPKLSSVKVEKVIPYPDGSPGFYFARLKYAENVKAIFAAERETRRQLVSGTVSLDGQTVALRYSQIDMGAPSLMFDNDSFTLMRGLEANPFILEFTFPEPRHVSGLTADFGLVNLALTVRLYPNPGGDPAIFSASSLSAKTGNPQVDIPFAGAPEKVSMLWLEILNPASGETANIHIRELHLLP